MAARRPSIFVFVEDRPPAIAAQSGRQHIRDYIARLACSLTLADLNVTHMPLIRHASAARASESMAIFSNAAFDWKKRAVHNLYWVVATEER
jgi:hypothetical protein